MRDGILGENQEVAENDQVRDADARVGVPEEIQEVPPRLGRSRGLFGLHLFLRVSVQSDVQGRVVCIRSRWVSTRPPW